MRDELTSVGFDELPDASAVDTALAKEGTTLVVVNSVCGCAAANARPGVRMSLVNEKNPDQLTTVFAGVDREATEAARRQMVPFPPSSPLAARISFRLALCLGGGAGAALPRLAAASE